MHGAGRDQQPIDEEEVRSGVCQEVVDEVVPHEAACTEDRQASRQPTTLESNVGPAEARRVHVDAHGHIMAVRGYA
jgi:hypothetical protein